MENNKESISLLELNQSIQFEIKRNFNSTYWIVAEISELKVNYSGHCYLELIEKDQYSEKVVAKARATIWAGNYRKLLPFFETTTKHTFCEGIKIMVRAAVEFHELYGFSLNIVDIDPTYTLGDIEKQRQQTIEMLKAEGVFDMNKELQLPEVIQKIAVISSEKAAGYGDFVEQLDGNEARYKFYHKLFPAIMQGENAEQSIINSLEKIYQYEDFFDVVVVIRGGGSKTDLSCFDKYWLAYHLAQYPIPVLTGIGHEQDDSVTDMIAHTRLKTPTAVASFLIERCANFEDRLDNAFFSFREELHDFVGYKKQKLVQHSTSLLTNVKLSISRKKEGLSHLKINTYNKSNLFIEHLSNKLTSVSNSTGNTVKNKLKVNQNNLHQYKKMVSTRVGYFLKNQKSDLQAKAKLTSAFDPQNVLNRGYSITYLDGKLVKDKKQLKEGDEIITTLKTGKVKSTVSK